MLLDYARLRARRYTVIVKLTSARNLACTYCYDFETLESAQKIDVEAAVGAIAQTLDACRDKLCIILHGGEPIRPETG